jgi:PAS domain S-box-containing protein
LERLALRAVRDGQPRYSYLTEHLRASGEGMTLAVNLSPVHEADGAISGFVALAADTTDAHRAGGRAPADPEMHFRVLVEGSPELIFELDAIGCVRSVNPAVLRVYGYPPEALLGQPISMLTDGAQAQKDLERLTAILEGAECTAYETSHIRKDASRVRLLVVAEPQRDGEGRVSGIIGAAIELDPVEVEQLASGGESPAGP